MALRFKRIFAESTELRIQNESLANGFPPIPGICKMFFEVENIPPLVQRGEKLYFHFTFGFARSEWIIEIIGEIICKKQINHQKLNDYFTF